jgi:hypothetical protein
MRMASFADRTAGRLERYRPLNGTDPGTDADIGHRSLIHPNDPAPASYVLRPKRVRGTSHSRARA